MSPKILYHLILSLLFLALPINSEDKLRWSFELFLHGASSPNFLSEENIDLFNHQWIGKNELTGVGLRQSFLVGYRDRLRYIEEKQLITSEYDPRDILVLSIESNRTIMSSYANIHGLFIPGTGPTIDPSLVDRAVPPVDESSYINEKDQLDQDDYTALPGKMNIIPIHLSFPYEHFTNYENGEKCVGVQKYEKNNKEKQDVKDFLKKLTEKYGKKLVKFFPDKNENMLTDYDFSLKLFDNIICLYMDGSDEFQNITSTLETSSDELLKDCYDFMNYDLIGNDTNKNEEFLPYLVSPLFNKLIEWMDYKIKKDNSGGENYHGYDLPKYVILSSDKATLNTFISFMSLVFNTEIKYPYYATNLHVELFKEENGNYRFEYYYNDELLLSISYDDFKQKVNKFLKSGNEIDSFCQFSQNIEEEDDSGWYLAGIIIAAVICVGLIIGIILMISKRNKLLSLGDAKLEPIKSGDDNRESNEI